LLRGIFGTTALYLFFTTVQHIPLASAMTIQYLSPIFTSIICDLRLERKGPFDAVALLRHRVRRGTSHRADRYARFAPSISAIGIISAFCSGVAYNLVRSLRGREHPLTIVLHFQLVGVVVGGLSLFFEWRTPFGLGLGLFLFLIGAFSQLGQIFLTNALQEGERSPVSRSSTTADSYTRF
jgi:drug/metabolite transporter (DMT)-like permease